MTDTGTAKLFMHGRSQAVRLPKAFRMPGTEVTVRRVGHGVLLEPVEPSIERIRATFARIDQRSDVPFMQDGREQPPMPSGDTISFDG